MKLLRLAALDEEDLKIVSAHLQDAVLKVGDITFEAGNKRLLLPLNRFAWEMPKRIFRTQNERRRSVLQIDRVTGLKSAGFNRKDGDAVLSLLAIGFSGTDAPSGTIDMVFSGNATMKVDVECIELRLTDLGAAWQASSRPRHSP